MPRFVTSSIITAALLSCTATSALFADKPGAKQWMDGGVAGIACGGTCPADLSGDGQVGPADLAFLLATWGPFPGEPEDLNDDGVVGPADLAILLAGWGGCPLAAPANDLCADALPILSPGTVFFCTYNAATDGPSLPAQSDCWTMDDTQVNSDVWYFYQPAGDGEVTLKVCGDGNFDTKIAVYGSILPGFCDCPSGGLDTATFIACDDDSASGVTGCDSEWGSTVTFDVVGGNCYKIRVGGYGNWEGTGTMEVQFQSVGSACYDGIPILDGETSFSYVGTTVDNTADFSPINCIFEDTIGEWFSIYGWCSGGEVTVSTCNPGTNFDTGLTVYKETIQGGCTAVEVECNDDACGASGLSSEVTFFMDFGYIYHIRVSGFSTAVGDYELTVDTVCP
jgi:hypothetical protein